MIESNASLSNEPIDLLEQVDLVAILKSRIPEENVNTAGNIQLVEISNSSLHKEILDRGKFSPIDLEELLQNEERLQVAVEFLVQENNRLTTIGKSKEEKILASIEMIVSQRDWVHSLLDDNVALRSEVDRHVKEKLDFDADMAYQISALKNAKEELQDETVNLKNETLQLENQIVDLDDQIKKSAGVLKKSQVHKNALSEKIEAMENNQIKYKWYMGILGAAAFVFFSIAVVSYIHSISQNGVNSSAMGSRDVSSNSTTTEDLEGGISPAKIITQGSPVEIAPDGFINSGVEEPVLVDNTKILDDSKVDEILKQSTTSSIPDEMTKPTKAISSVNKKEQSFSKSPDVFTSKPSKSTVVSNKKDQPNTKPVDLFASKTTIATNTPSKTAPETIKPYKPEIVNVKKPKKSNQTYVIKEKDSLYQISKKFYGSGNYANKIKKENKLGSTLVPGKKLIISALGEE